MDLNKTGAFTLFPHRLKIACLDDSEFWQASRDKELSADWLLFAQGYLVKPVDNDELIEQVSRIISAAKRTTQ